MRRFLVCTAAAATALSLVGCEDGPGQVYNPSAEGAGERWNNGEAPPTWDENAKNGYKDDFGGTSRQVLCSGAEKQAAWAKMITEPLVPPRLLAGLDLAGGDQWPGLDFKLAEKKLCQSDALGADSGGNLYAAWGDAGEVIVGYSLSNNKINFIQLNEGYKGTIDFKSRPTSRFSTDGQHTYQIGIGKQILRDSKPFTLHWEEREKLDNEGTELFDAMMYSFAPELPSDAVNCRASGACRLLPDGVGGGGFGARNVGFYFHVPSIHKPQPIPSKPDYFYLFPVKVLPFSNAEMFLKLDAEGPIATARDLGDRTPKAQCKMQMGMTYKTFLNDCVTVLKDPAGNQVAKNKLLGNMLHSTENYYFDVAGVNIDFHSSAIGTDDVIHDDWFPSDNDEASEYIVDIRANGKMLNEYAADGTTFTLGGTAAIYREYTRLVQNELHAMMAPNLPRHELGAPECLLPADTTGINFQTWRPAAGCTGLEQLISPSMPDTGKPNLDKMSVGPNIARALGMTTVMKPGDPRAVFCGDPGVFDHCGGPSDYVGFNSSLWDGTYKRVLDYLGGGNVFNLPAPARDRKFYFKVWGTAYIKYLKAAHLFPTDLSKPEFDAYEPEPDHLIFDDLGAENEKFEYIDRRFVSPTREPMKFEYEALITAGNQRDSKFHRRMTRAERTLYRVMQADKTQPEGVEDTHVRLMNLVGSPVLRGGWRGVSAEKDAYFCATHDDADCTAGGGPKNAPPKEKGAIVLDGYGKPLLTNYKGAFQQTPFTIGTSHMKMVQVKPLIRSAIVDVPEFTDPINPRAQGAVAPPMARTIADYRPKTPDNTFRIPINGQRDRHIPSASIDFTGTSLSLNLDVKENDDGTLTVEAMQSNDYMGELFLCKDPATGDLLHLKAYESMARVVEWIQDHPGSYNACGFIIRYSPFNNYPQALIVKKAGMYLYVNAGSGFGRISSVEIWDPNL